MSSSDGSREFKLYVDAIDGGIAAWSPDLPQLNLFSYDEDKPLHDLEPLVQRILARRFRATYRVFVVAAGEPHPSAGIENLPPSRDHRLIAVRDDPVVAGA